MTSNTGTNLRQYIESLNYLLNKNDAFMREFSQYSRAGNRHGMIDMIMQQEQALKLTIIPSFIRKDDTKAGKLFEQIEKMDENNKNVDRVISNISKINLLNEALLAVTINSPLLIEIMSMRTKIWYYMGYYVRCCKDCDYAIEVLSNKQLEDHSQYKTYIEKFREIKKQSLTVIHKINRKNNSDGIQHVNNDKLNIPDVDGRRNKKLMSCSDAIGLAYNPIQGRHLIAAKNIKAGSVLMVDEPFSFSTDQHALLTNCLHCHVSLFLNEQIQIPCVNCQTVSFCSEKCRKEAWNNYHKYECFIFQYFINDTEDVKTYQHRSHILLAYRATIAKAVDKKNNILNDEFFKYQNDGINNNIASNGNKYLLKYNMKTDIYDPLDYKTMYSLKTHCKKSHPKINFLRSVKSVFLAKCFDFAISEISKDKIIDQSQIKLIAVATLRHMQAIDCNAYEIVENIRDESTKTWEPQNVGGAIYTTVSLINHSCYPNIVRHSYPTGKVVIRATRFIEKGSEILDCYGPHFISDDLPTRQKYLREKYHFMCTCEACKHNWQFSKFSDPLFRCITCGSAVDFEKSRCQLSSCSRKVDVRKLTDQFTRSIKKRIAAIGKMYDGYYLEALPLLLEHSVLVDKILISPNIEAIKTQQSIIQCYNSIGNTSKMNHYC